MDFKSLQTKEQDIIDILSHLEERGVFSFVAVTGKTALKKSRVTKLPTPSHLVSVTKITYSTVSLGNSYEQAVNNRLKKEGKDADFESKGTYCHQVNDSKILYKHNERDEYYVRVYPNLCHSFHTVVKYFDINGTPIENWRIVEEEYFPTKGTNTNQGLDNPIAVNNYSLKSVKYLKRGDFKINELDQEILDKLA